MTFSAHSARRSRSRVWTFVLAATAALLIPARAEAVTADPVLQVPVQSTVGAATLAAPAPVDEASTIVAQVADQVAVTTDPVPQLRADVAQPTAVVADQPKAGTPTTAPMAASAGTRPSRGAERKMSWSAGVVIGDKPGTRRPSRARPAHPDTGPDSVPASGATDRGKPARSVTSPPTNAASGATPARAVRAAIEGSGSAPARAPGMGIGGGLSLASVTGQSADLAGSYGGAAAALLASLLVASTALSRLRSRRFLMWMECPG